MILDVQHSVCLSRKYAEISLSFSFTKCFIKHWVTIYPEPNAFQCCAGKAGLRYSPPQSRSFVHLLPLLPESQTSTS